jgi:hypothetical protein
MRQDEFQVWLQSYLTGVQAVALRPTPKDCTRVDVIDIILGAKKIANTALETYREVPAPQKIDIDGIKSVVENVVKNSVIK